MASPVILVTEVFPVEGKVNALATSWAAQKNPAICRSRTVYQSLDNTSCLELIALSDIGQLADMDDFWQQSWSLLGTDLKGDFRRQVLRFVEAPKNVEDPLPKTPYIQLRHVEVVPAVYCDYLAWRDRTIFNVVRKAPEVEVFLAYHSVISSEPGVMFLSGFSCEVDQYSSVFNSADYQKIVAEAGSTYITGGERGLYTKIYRAV